VTPARGCVALSLNGRLKTCGIGRGGVQQARMPRLNPGLLNNQEASVAVNRSKSEPGVVANGMGSHHVTGGARTRRIAVPEDFKHGGS
jgi:hypothetical protein